LFSGLCVDFDASCPCSNSRTTRYGGQGAATPPAPYIPDHNFDTRHIALNLRFDWKQEQVIGTETIVLPPLVSNLKRVELDAANMTFSSIKLKSGTALKYETGGPNEKLHIMTTKRGK
jgi:aminopeptidase N